MVAKCPTAFTGMFLFLRQNLIERSEISYTIEFVAAKHQHLSYYINFKKNALNLIEQIVYGRLKHLSIFLLLNKNQENDDM